MTERCFHMDELASLLDLKPGDPREQHLAACPLCRARLAAYKAFVAEGPPLTGSQPERAKADLDEFLVRMIYGDSRAGGETGFRARLRQQRISRFVLVPGLAAAAVAVILFVVLSPFSRDRLRQEAPLRGIESPTADGSELAVQPAVITDGVVTFRWYHVPGSDRYEIQVFDAKLEQIARFEANRQEALEVSISQIPATGGPLWWRIVAFRNGDAVAHSPLSPLELRGRPTE
jgi:hypothetical protein